MTNPVPSNDTVAQTIDTTATTTTSAIDRAAAASTEFVDKEIGRASCRERV